MKLLAFDSAAKTTACVVFDTEKGVLAESFSNNGYTHSKTLLPMIEQCLAQADCSIQEIEGFGVTRGPGSFTGLRIGVATVKGLAFAKNLPCAPLSTLEATAYMSQYFSGIVCPVMDARRGQVYNALFEWQEGELVRLTPDRAIAATDLLEELKEKGQKVLLLGDGALLCHACFFGNISVELAQESFLYLRGSALALLCKKAFEKGETMEAEELSPVYLRLSQAERERQEKENAQ